MSNVIKHPKTPVDNTSDAHTHVETTMIYTHVLNKGGRWVISPLDL